MCYSSKGKVSPIGNVAGKGFPNAAVTTLKGKVSQQKLGAKENLRLTQQHNTTHLTQEIYWESHKRVVTSAWTRRSKELSRRQTLKRIYECSGFHSRNRWISSSELGEHSGIGGFLRPEIGEFSKPGSKSGLFNPRVSTDHTHLSTYE